MTTQELQRDLNQAVKSIIQETHPLKIVLFGSHARGDSSSASDIDLLVIQGAPFDPAKDRYEFLNRLFNAVRFMQAPADILVYSSNEVQAWSQTKNHVVSRALREGRVLYERP